MPQWTANATRTGTVSPDSHISARVYLQPRGGTAALDRDVIAVATPGSPTYHHFLTPAQYRAKYAPTSATMSAVRAWLTKSGLHVTAVGPDRHYLAVSGSAGAAESAFGTTLATFRSGSTRAQAPTTAVRVPASLASSVLTVTGLDTKPYLATPAKATPVPPPAGFRNARPCSTYFGQIRAKYQADYSTPLPKFDGEHPPYQVCGYTGPYLRAAYEGNTTLDGSGVTVAIVDAYASPTIASDAETYAENHGDGSYAPGQLTQVQPSVYGHKNECGASGWFTEETLDVEAVHAMAPAANIRFYAGSSCASLNDAVQKVVDENQAQIVTNSYGFNGEAGLPASLIAAEHATFQQAGMQGISVLFSSGDYGDELMVTGSRQPDYEASDPAVTAVGGTATGIGKYGNKIFDTAWGTVKYTLSNNQSSWNEVGFTSGGGGGFSTLFNRPSYQDGVVQSSSRGVPDVAMDADPQTGMLIGQTQTFPDGVYYDEFKEGGTSLASPLFAGMTALALQQNNGYRLGLLNPTLYSDYGTNVFEDVKGNPPEPAVVRADFANSVDSSDGIIYSVRELNKDSSLKVTKGWDDATGLGVPTTDYFSAFSGGRFAP